MSNMRQARFQSQDKDGTLYIAELTEQKTINGARTSLATFRVLPFDRSEIAAFDVLVEDGISRLQAFLGNTPDGFRRWVADKAGAVYSTAPEIGQYIAS